MRGAEDDDMGEGVDAAVACGEVARIICVGGRLMIPMVVLMLPFLLLTMCFWLLLYVDDV